MNIHVQSLYSGRVALYGRVLTLLCLVATLWTASVSAAEQCLTQLAAGRFVVHCEQFNNAVALDGEWLMVWGRFVEPEQLDSLDEQQIGTSRLPGLWMEQLSSDGLGSMTLFADIEFPAPVADLELWPGWVNSAHRIQVRSRNGNYVTVFKNAELESLGAEEAGRLSTLPVLLPELGMKTRVVIHIHNGPYFTGGASEAPGLSPRGLLMKAHEDRRSAHAFLVGAFFIMALYNLALWKANWKRYERLVLGLISLNVCVRNFAMGGMLESGFLESTMKTYHYFGWYTFCVAMVLWAFYFRFMFPTEFKRWMLLLCLLPVVALLLISPLLSLAEFIDFGRVLRNFVWIPFLFTLYAAGSSAYRRRPGGGLMLLGVAIMLFCAALDLRVYEQGAKPILEYANVGFFVFVVMQTGYLSREFVHSLNQQAVLAEELKVLNTSLEQKVVERTNALEEANSRLRELGLRDPLTQLSNRRAFDETIALEIKRAQREQHHLSLAIIDVDHFKVINDSHGHQIGDQVLVGLSKRMKYQVRETDFVARIGGEEFAIILPDTYADDASWVLNTLRESIERRPLPLTGMELKVTVSIGVASWVPDEDEDALYRKADQALYHAKSEGRNRVAIHRAGQLELMES